MQCCGAGAGAGGADIILEPVAGAGKKFLINISAVSLEDTRMKKRALLPLLG